MKKNHAEHLNILVVRLSALGDVAMTIPAIYSCACQWPQHTFHVVTTSFCSQLFIHPPVNVITHTIDKHDGMWHILRQLGKLDIDIVADLHNVLRSWIIDAFFLLKGKRVRMVDKKRLQRKQKLRQHDDFMLPYTRRYYNVFARFGLKCKPTFYSLFQNHPVENLPLEDCGLTLDEGTRLIGIAPFARYSNKIYPLEQMRRVAELLASRPDVQVLLFGSRGKEAEELQTWTGERITSVAGRFSLSDELALMSRLDVMVSMDSANQHMASLVNTRVVTLWGSTAPTCGFVPWGQDDDDSLCLYLDCQPCTTAGSPRCPLGTLDCLRKISPERVVEQIFSI